MFRQVYLLILMVSTLCSADYPAHVYPPKFPEGCKMPSTSGPVVRQLPPIEYPWGRAYICTIVGGACSSNADSPEPKPEDCIIPPNAGKKVAPSPKSARCIDGFCRDLSERAGDTCDCFIGCNFKVRGSTRDLSCTNGQCTEAECAPCGEAPNNRQCCGSGVIGHDGNCYLATGVGEGCGVNPSKCSSGGFNDECCGKGTKNDGFCCASGTCNGVCSHQPA